MRLYLLVVLITLEAAIKPLSPAQINEWQFLDKNGMVYPWYTKPFLDVLSKWDVSDWDILEWGGGYSTVWWAYSCKSVVTIEDNFGWIKSIEEYLQRLNLNNVTIKFRPGDTSKYNISDGGEDSEFVNAIDEDNKLYDCIIIDGEVHRNTCATKVLKHLKPNGVVILDNANQASCGINSLPTFELFKSYKHHSFLQPGHRDWKTDYWVVD